MTEDQPIIDKEEFLKYIKQMNKVEWTNYVYQIVTTSDSLLATHFGQGR